MNSQYTCSPFFHPFISVAGLSKLVGPSGIVGPSAPTPINPPIPSGAWQATFATVASGPDIWVRCPVCQNLYSDLKRHCQEFNDEDHLVLSVHGP